MHYGEIRTWAQVVHRSRRFFAPEAAQEVWDEFSPALGNIFTPQCLEVHYKQYADNACQADLRCLKIMYLGLCARLADGKENQSDAISA